MPPTTSADSGITISVTGGGDRILVTDKISIFSDITLGYKINAGAHLDCGGAIHCKRIHKDYQGLQCNKCSLMVAFPKTLKSIEELIYFFENYEVEIIGQPVMPPVTPEDNNAIKKKYMGLCGYKRKATMVQSIRLKTEELKSAIQRSQQELVTSIRALEDKESELRILETSDDTSTAYGEEFDKLTEHPDIEKIDIVNNNILVYTKLIVIHHGGRNYNIGKYKVEIDTSGLNGGVRMFNLTRTAGGFHHPHVAQEGTPCLGNIKGVIPQLIAERKYSALIAICIQYLKSYNDAHDGRPYLQISDWA